MVGAGTGPLHLPSVHHLYAHPLQVFLAGGGGGGGVTLVRYLVKYTDLLKLPLCNVS